MQYFRICSKYYWGYGFPIKRQIQHIKCDTLALAFQHPILHAMRGQIFSKFLLHHGFVVGPVADVHLGNRVAFEDDEVGADAVEEPAIVANDDGDACEF